MFKILGRNIRKSLGLFLVFFTISIVFSIFSSFIESQRISGGINNEILTPNFITLNFNYTNNGTITNNDFMKILDEEKGIIISKPISKEKNDKSYFSGNAIYFNKGCENIPPIYEGKFFSANDFSKDISVAIVGKDLLNSLEIREDEKYFIFENRFYKVVGVMGYKNKSSFYDSKFIINLNSYISNRDSFIKELNIAHWNFDNIDISAEDSINNVYKKLNAIDKKLKINVLKASGEFNPLMSAVEIYKSSIFILIIFVLVLFINIVNISSFWVLDMKKEIGIRKALGGRNKNIIFKIICKYQLIAFSAAVFALVSHLILIKLSIGINYINALYGVESSIDIVNVGILFIFTLFIGLLVSIIPIKQIIKMEANDIIRGR